MMIEEGSKTVSDVYGRAYPKRVHGLAVWWATENPGTLQNMAPGLMRKPLTTPGALGWIRPLSTGFPDYQLPEPPASLAAIKLLPLTVEQIFELMRAPRRL